MSTALETHGICAHPPRAFEKLKKDIELHLFKKSEDGKSIVSTCKECNLSQKTPISLPAFTENDKLGDPTGIHRFDTALLKEFTRHLHDGRDFTNYYMLPPMFGDYYDEPFGLGGEEESGYGGEDDSEDSGAEDESGDSGAEEETGEGAEYDREIEELLDTIEDGLQF